MSRQQPVNGRDSFSVPSPHHPIAPSPHHPIIFSPPQGAMLAWLAALLVARWLMPTEGADEGLTLWVVQLVLLTAVGRAAWDWRLGEKRVRIAAMDGAIGLLILAQVVSAMAVVCGVGNARAAINLAWEWIGSGVLIWMLRQDLTSMRVVRQLCLGMSLIAGVLAGYGLWQHYIGYGDLGREYDQLVSEHDRLVERMRDDRGTLVLASATDAKRLAMLREQMARQQIPIEKEARQSLENRLKRSSEPLGLFALANSFAGLLIVMGLVVIGLIEEVSIRDGTIRRLIASQWGTILLAMLIAFCVLLTKSRTAWAGLLAGVGWWTLRMIAARSHRTDGRRTPWMLIGTWFVIGAFVLGMVIGIAALSGGLDQAVVSEATKSLRYRLEYWQATWVMIREHLWLGTGPGNFRDYYLPHKLPQSSEEISDPHNFILDVWANAGTLGLIGLLACVGLIVREAIKGSRRSSGNELRHVENVPHGSDWTSPAVWGVGLACPVCAAGMELLGQGSDERLWWLGGIWWGVWLIGMVWSRQTRAVVKAGTPAMLASEGASLAFQASMKLPFALEAAIVALLVHLLGAGGIAMPAITQLFWLVWAMRTACSESAGGGQDGKSPSESASRGVMAGQLGVAGSTFAAGGLFVACLWTATMPELICRTSLQAGDFEWRRGQIEVAHARFLEADQADRWAIEPIERLAEVSFQRWRTAHRDRDFEETVQQLEHFKDLLPFSSRPYRRLGQVWLAKFEQSHDIEDARKSVAYFEGAVERYPHLAKLLAEWAIACEAAGLANTARDVALRALRQDNINRQAGHSDKYLSPDLRSRMERLTGEIT